MRGRVVCGLSVVAGFVGHRVGELFPARRRTMVSVLDSIVLIFVIQVVTFVWMAAGILAV
jgi:hypothetical protein